MTKNSSEIKSRFNETTPSISMQEAVNILSKEQEGTSEPQYKIEFRSEDIKYISAVHNYIAIVDSHGDDIAQLHGETHNTKGTGGVNFFTTEDRLHAFTYTYNDQQLKRSIENYILNGNNVNNITSEEMELLKQGIEQEEKDTKKLIDENRENTEQSTTLRTGSAAEIASATKVLYGLMHLMNEKDMAYISEPWAKNQNSNSVAETLAYALGKTTSEEHQIYKNIWAPGKDRMLLSDAEIEEINNIIIHEHKMPLNSCRENIEEITKGETTYELHEYNSYIPMNTPPKEDGQVIDIAKEHKIDTKAEKEEARLITVKRIIEADPSENGNGRGEHNIPYKVDGEDFNLQNTEQATKQPASPSEPKWAPSTPPTHSSI